MITTRQLFFSYPILARLNNCQLPIGLAVRLRILLVELAPRYDVINNLKSSIVGHYTTVLPDGSTALDPDRKSEFVAAMDELFNAQVNIAVSEKFPLEQLKNVAGFELGETEQELLEQWLVYREPVKTHADTNRTSNKKRR